MMPISRKIVISINLASVLVSFSTLSHAVQTATHTPIRQVSPTQVISSEGLSYISNNRSYFYIDLLYLQPSSDNLKFGTFVSGNQPFQQSWHYQAVDPSYHGAFELGFNYVIPQTPYSASVSWLHLHSSDSASKQASTNTDLSTVEFVGPEYEMSPPVFGIKHVNSNAQFDFDNILLNVSQFMQYSPRLSMRFFGGIAILRLNETVTTTFSDYAGSPPTAYSYPLPPDPSFSFQTENFSKYLGAGPDVGVAVRYQLESGFGILGEFLGLLTVGTIKTGDNFTSTSARLTALGYGTSHQEITAPNAKQVVLGADGKLGVFYHYRGPNVPSFTVEAGYRMATYLNAISTVSPNTLVQPGTVFITPEFSTGTMAIVSTTARSRPFSYSGPFIDIKVELA